MVSKQTREARLAAGKCASCGKRKAKKGHTRCEACRAAFNAFSKAWRESRKMSGLCVKCGDSAAAEGHYFCASCALYMGEAQKALRERYRAEYRCISCARKLAPKREAGRFARCAKCRAKARAYYYRRKGGRVE